MQAGLSLPQKGARSARIAFVPAMRSTLPAVFLVRCSFATQLKQCSRAGFGLDGGFRRFRSISAAS